MDTLRTTIGLAVISFLFGSLLWRTTVLADNTPPPRAAEDSRSSGKIEPPSGQSGEFALEYRTEARSGAATERNYDRVQVVDLRGDDKTQPRLNRARPESRQRMVRRPNRFRQTPYLDAYGFNEFSLDDPITEAYDAGRWDERHDRGRRFNERDMAARQERLLAQHEKAVRAGLRRMKAGQYPQALAALSLAARLNEGDPACRIHLAQVQLALGHYAEAGAALRRAVQLQPQLIYYDLHLARYYQNEDEIELYTQRLSDWLSENAVKPEVYFVYGYMEFQQGNSAEAWKAFTRLEEAWPRDDAVREFLSLTQPANP